MKREPLTTEAGLASAVDYLLREYRTLQRPAGSAESAADWEQFTGPIDSSFLVAAENARAELRTVADFKCSGADDQAEIGAAFDLMVGDSSSNGGRVNLTGGDFSLTDYIDFGMAATAKTGWLAGAGINATVLETTGTTTPAATRDAVVTVSADLGMVTDMTIRCLDAGFKSCVTIQSVEKYGIAERVLAYTKPDVTELLMYGAFHVGEDSWLRDCIVDVGSEGAGVYVAGHNCVVDSCYIRSSTAQGLTSGDGIYINSSGDGTHVVNNRIDGTIAGYGIQVTADNCVILGNTCPDGILIQSTANGTIVGGNTGTITDNGTNTVFLDNVNTTKGDLFGYSTRDARVPVGADDQVLTADSTQALGLKWVTPGKATVLMLGGM